MDPIRVTLSLAGIVIIIFAAYYATWFVSTRASGQGGGRLRNKNINMVDRFAISKDKSFCLIEIAGKVYVIGVTNQSMTLLDTLDAAAFAETGEERRDTAAWHMIPKSRLAGRMVNRLAAFIAQRMGKRLDAGEGGGSATFADCMEGARERKAPGQPGRAKFEQVTTRREKNDRDNQ